MMQALAKMAGMRAADSPDLADKDQLHAEAERGPIPFARKGKALLFCRALSFLEFGRAETDRMAPAYHSRSSSLLCGASRSSAQSS